MVLEFVYPLVKDNELGWAAVLTDQPDGRLFVLVELDTSEDRPVGASVVVRDKETVVSTEEVKVSVVGISVPMGSELSVKVKP